MTKDEMDDVLYIILTTHSDECSSMHGEYTMKCNCLSWTIYQNMRKHFRILLSDPWDMVGS